MMACPGVLPIPGSRPSTACRHNPDIVWRMACGQPHSVLGLKGVYDVPNHLITGSISAGHAIGKYGWACSGVFTPYEDSTFI